MSTSAISPVSSLDFASTSATSAEQAVFASLLNQLQQAVGSGNLDNTATLLNAVEALSPSSVSANSPLGTFLTSLGTALNDGSSSEAQSALATYQNATSSASSSSTSSSSAQLTANSSQTAAEIAAGLIQSQIQLSLVSTLLGANAGSSSDSSDSASSSSSSANSLISLLNAAYGTSDSSSSAAGTSATGAVSSTTSLTPYDTLVSSIQASLAGGNGTITPALAYLQASGNFVNTSA